MPKHAHSMAEGQLNGYCMAWSQSFEDGECPPFIDHGCRMCVVLFWLGLSVMHDHACPFSCLKQLFTGHCHAETPTWTNKCLRNMVFIPECSGLQGGQVANCKWTVTPFQQRHLSSMTVWWLSRGGKLYWWYVWVNYIFLPELLVCHCHFSVFLKFQSFVLWHEEFKGRSISKCVPPHLLVSHCV